MVDDRMPRSTSLARKAATVSGVAGNSLTPRPAQRSSQAGHSRAVRYGDDSNDCPAFPTRGSSRSPSPSFCSPVIGPLNLSSAASRTRFIPKPCAGRWNVPGFGSRAGARNCSVGSRSCMAWFSFLANGSIAATGRAAILGSVFGGVYRTHALQHAHSIASPAPSPVSIGIPASRVRSMAFMDMMRFAISRAVIW
jgi:hypothetical protein